MHQPKIWHISRLDLFNKSENTEQKREQLVEYEAKDLDQDHHNKHTESLMKKLYEFLMTDNLFNRKLATIRGDTNLSPDASAIILAPITNEEGLR